ncbi:putative quinol monooxygenase [Colwellia sp. RE-S-Sl-9]
MAIVRINEFKSAEGQAEALLEFLTSIKPYITNSEGCISCEILTQQDDKSTFVIIEKWESIESHVKSIADFPKDDMAKAIPLFGAAPIGRYFMDV